MYAFSTHDRPAGDKPSERCIGGRATFTMVASSTTISWQVKITTGTIVAWRGGAGGEVRSRRPAGRRER